MVYRAARRLLDKEGATPEQVNYIIEWLGSPGGEFWSRNILSMPKLRAQWSRLVLEVKGQQRPRRSTANGGAVERRNTWITEQLRSEGIVT